MSDTRTMAHLARRRQLLDYARVRRASWRQERRMARAAKLRAEDEAAREAGTPDAARLREMIGSCEGSVRWGAGYSSEKMLRSLAEGEAAGWWRYLPHADGCGADVRQTLTATMTTA